MADADWADHHRRLRNAVDQLAQVQEFDLFDDSLNALEDIIADAENAKLHASALLEECRRRKVDSVRALLNGSG